MQFFKVAALLALVSTGLAAPQPEAQDLAKRGFGCPDDGPCNTHCISIGRNGGYCSGFLWQVCTCNEKA